MNVGQHGQVQSSIGSIVRQSSLDRAVADSTDRGEEVKRQQTIERQMLEKDLQEKMKIQQEGRKREALARERAMSRQRVEAARALESKNPMTLAGETDPPFSLLFLTPSPPDRIVPLDFILCQ
jgi:hypothetical protein